ncbi:hypothetical protein, partial [Pseudomonas aeruginosa]|uniref:hypothetical protein n=1 Tax=Pseudomonas aeruginosa TaxID=287 RepID=UPI001C610E7C
CHVHPLQIMSSCHDAPASAADACLPTLLCCVVSVSTTVLVDTRWNMLLLHTAFTMLLSSDGI